MTSKVTELIIKTVLMKTSEWVEYILCCLRENFLPLLQKLNESSFRMSYF